MILCALMALITGLCMRTLLRRRLMVGRRDSEGGVEKVQQLAFSNLDHFAVSSLITRMTTDVTVLQNMVNAGFRPVTRGRPFW